MLVNKQQGNKLYITYVLQDATYFLVLFLEWVCLRSRQALFLGGFLMQWDANAISYCIKKKKGKHLLEYHRRILRLLLAIQIKRPWLGSKASEEDGKSFLSPLCVCVCGPLVTNN